MLCQNSKVYHIWGTDKEGKEITKTSCKGVQQKPRTQNPCRVENAGFLRDEQGTIKTCTQENKGFSYFYAKRKVLSDGVSTVHLDI